jgi:hypothetical protein
VKEVRVGDCDSRLGLPPSIAAKEIVVDDETWPQTNRAIADAERATKGDYDLTDDEDVELGMSLLRALAAESDGHIREYEPGRFYVSKLDD